MRGFLSVVKSLLPWSAKNSLPRDASLSLPTLTTKISQQIYSNDSSYRAWKRELNRRNRWEKNDKKMAEQQAGLNPEANAFTVTQEAQPLEQQRDTVVPVSQASVKKKSGKKARAVKSKVKGAITQDPEESQTPKNEANHTDPKIAPSAESGGTPNPAQPYLLSAFKPPSTLPHPRPILIVMDLNGTILHRPVGRNNQAAFVERPHATRFMKYCLETFHVAIWSSARPNNVRKMVAKLLTPEQVQKCILVWSRDQLGLSASDYNLRVQCYKRLDSIWNDPDIKASYPGETGQWDQSNTVLVDDSFEKGRSEPYNILALPEFANTALERQHVLPQVHDYLNELACQDNVSRYMWAKPFKLDPGYTLPVTGV